MKERKKKKKNERYVSYKTKGMCLIPFQVCRFVDRGQFLLMQLLLSEAVALKKII
jgi:hypothetical protein